MNVYFLDKKGNKVPAPALEKNLLIAFGGSTVWAGAETGRASIAKGLSLASANLLQAGLMTLVLEDEKGKETRNVSDWATILAEVENACNAVAEVKSRFAKSNDLYQAMRKYEEYPQDVPAGKRGRVKADNSPEAVLARTLAAMGIKA